MRLRSLLFILVLLPQALSAAADTARSALPADSVYHLSAAFTDSEAQAVRWNDLRGQPRLVSMFYTSCRYVCPMIVDGMRSIERRLSAAERQRIGFVLISMDPARDTPAVLSKLRRERRIADTGWLLLRPEPEDLRGLAAMLGIRYRALTDGEFNHTTTLVLLDRDGRVLARTERVGGAVDSEFLAAVKAAVAPAQR